MSDAPATPKIDPASPQAEPWWVKPGLALTIILLFAGVLWTVAGSTDHDLKVALFTIAGGAFLTAVGFYFGYSAHQAAPPVQGPTP